MFIKATHEEAAVLGPSHLTPPPLLMRRSLTPLVLKGSGVCVTDRERQRGIERQSCCYSFINNQSSSSDAIAVNNLQIHRGRSDQQLEGKTAGLCI